MEAPQKRKAHAPPSIGLLTPKSPGVLAYLYRTSSNISQENTPSPRPLPLLCSDRGCAGQPLMKEQR